jgi:hypothetical protein
MFSTLPQTRKLCAGRHNPPPCRKLELAQICLSFFSKVDGLGIDGILELTATKPYSLNGEFRKRRILKIKPGTHQF